MTINEMTTELNTWIGKEFDDFEHMGIRYETGWSEDDEGIERAADVRIDNYVAYQREGGYGIHAAISENETLVPTQFYICYADGPGGIDGKAFEDIRDAAAYISRLEKIDREANA